MEFEDELTLDSGHSIILGHKPKKLGSEKISKDIFSNAEVSKSIESFGLFGGGLNYNTYYPELEVDDIVPKDEEFIEPMYRMLSEVIISKYYPTDFSRNGVLKKSMPLIIGQTINCDHETDTGNAIGAVSDVAWQESYKIGDKVIPAGINGIFKIDAKSNPRLARGIMMNPPSIHSNSVTVRFLWEPSHPKMEMEEFYNKMGSYDENGDLICRVVTEILSYMETSLVSAGADPFAKQVKDGKIVLPDTAIRNYSYSVEKGDDNIPFFSFDYKDTSRMDTIHNTMVFNYEQKNNSKNNNNKMEELEKFFASIYGEGKLTLKEGATKPTAGDTVELISGLITNASNLKAENDRLTGELANKVEEIKTLGEGKISAADKELIELGKSSIASLKSNATENYKKLFGDKADPSMLTLIEGSSSENLVALNKGYKLQLDQKFPLKCGKCGSNDVSRGSSLSNSEKKDETKEVAPRTVSSAISKLREGKLGSTVFE